MPDKPSEHPLIDAFFDALAFRNLAQCQAVLAQLAVLATDEPFYTLWHTYFSGVLANEQDHDWAKAEQLFLQVLAGNPNPPLNGRCWLALGRTYDYQGRWADAVAAYKSALSTAETLGKVTDQARAYKNMAISYCKGFLRSDYGTSDLEQAAAYCQSALALLASLVETSTEITWLIGSIWNVLGLIRRSQGQWQEAVACYQHDLAICRQLDDQHGMGLTYGNLGEIYHILGPDHWDEALAAYEQALQLVRAFDNRYEEIEALASLGYLYQEMERLDQALTFYDEAITLIEGVRIGISSEEARAGFFSTIVDIYANTVLLCAQTGQVECAFNYAERARARAFIDILASDAPDLSMSVDGQLVTLAEAQAALPADALLLDYFTTGLEEVRLARDADRQGIRRHRFPPARILLFAVTQNDAQIYELALSPNDLRPRQLDSVVERHFLQPTIRRMLYQRLLAPIEPQFREKRQLYLVPHGPLHYIPFHALIAADGETVLRRDGPQLIYGPSVSVLFRPQQRPVSQAPYPCLALAYNGNEAMALRFAEEEASRIAGLTGGRAEVGPEAKKTLLYKEAHAYRLLHLCCHGIFDPDLPLASALYLGQDEPLTARDVLENLRLNCELVILSACESGLNRVRRGDELIGFVRAFMVAGTPTLITTLWRVDDRSTRLLMEKFYQEIGHGIDFATALHRAQLYLKTLSGQVLPPEMIPEGADPGRPFADPYYWAPFTLVGRSSTRQSLKGSVG